MRFATSCCAASLLLCGAAAPATAPTPDTSLDNETAGCEVVCPPGSYEEDEPICTANYVDVTNGGCNSVPPVFTRIPPWYPGDWTFCGTYGGFTSGDLPSRDTDWYEIDVCSPFLPITWCATGEYETLVGIINAMGGCPVTSFYAEAIGSPCQEACITAQLPYGTWRLFVATSTVGEAAGACGGNYVARLSGYFCGDLATEPSSWGRVKSIYR